MRRAWMILLAGFLLGAGGYWATYRASTACCPQPAGPTPELAWLKQEFHLDDTEYGRICKLHEAYLAGCAERCRQIDEKNRHLKRLLEVTNAVTPEIERVLAETAQLRAECQKKMLQQFYEVSRTMPPEQGKRYLAWIQERTILSDTHSQMHH